MIISFAWTTPALLAGAKTVTRREWKPEYASRFKVGMLVDAWDRSPRTGKGKKVATIRLTRDPYLQWTDDLPRSHYEREGFVWMEENGLEGSVRDTLGEWNMRPRFIWVVEFELVECVG